MQASHFCWQQSLDTRFSFFLAANQINLFGLWSTKLIPIYTAFRNYPNFLRLHFSGNFFVRCYLLRRKKGRGGNAEMKEGDKPEGIRDTCQVRTCFKQKSAKKTGQTRRHLGHMMSDEEMFQKEYWSAFSQSITSKNYSGPKWGHVMKRREKPI